MGYAPNRIDLICLPECSFTGYLYQEVDFLRFAEPIPGPLTTEMTRLDPALKLLLVPTARSFDGQSPDGQRWETEERQVYLDAVKQAGVFTVIVNAMETGTEEPSFGGALVISAQGELLAESPHGSDEILIYDLD